MRRLARSDLAELAGVWELTNLSFDGLDLVGCDFADRTIEDCTFRGSRLTDAKFNASVIRRCEFADAAMQGVSFFGATIEECKMMGLDLARGTRLAAATFTKVNLDYASLKGLDLTNLEFTSCSMRECDLSRADLSNASLIDCDLTDADWSGTTTRDTDLRGSSIRGVDLRVGPYGVIVTSPQAVFLVEDAGVQVIDPADAG